MVNGRLADDLMQTLWILFFNETLTMTSAESFVANIDQKITVAKRISVFSNISKWKGSVFVIILFRKVKIEQGHSGSVSTS